MEHFTITVSLLIMAAGCYAGVIGEEDTCPRYSPQEFFSTLFLPILNQRLVFLERFLRIATDEVEELLKNESKDGGGDRNFIVKQSNF